MLTDVAARDRIAFGVLVDRHCPASWSLARSLCAADMATDVVVEVFRQLWQHPERAEGDTAALAHHLMRGTHRAAVAALNGGGPHRAAASNGRRPAGGLDVSDECVRLARSLDGAMVRRLAELPPAEREIIVLAYVGAYTCIELSALFDRTPSEVATNIRRGLAALRAADAGPIRTVVVVASGELDVVSMTDLRERLDAAGATAPTMVVVDLADLTSFDASTIGAFVGARNELRAAGGDLALRSPSPLLRRVLAMMGLDDLREGPAPSSGRALATEPAAPVVQAFREIGEQSRAEIVLDQATGLIAGRLGLTIGAAAVALQRFALRCDQPVRLVARDLLDGTRATDDVRASLSNSGATGAPLATSP